MGKPIFPQVTACQKFQIYMEQAQVLSEAFVDRFYVHIKRSHDGLWFEYTHLHTESSAKRLLELAKEKADDFFSAGLLKELECAVSHSITHIEVVQASMLEPHEEAAVWARWERIDAAADRDAQYAAYRNEY